MSPERLGATLARLLVYALVACGGGYLLHIARPERPPGATGAVLFCGMVVVGALLRMRRRARA